MDFLAVIRSVIPAALEAGAAELKYFHGGGAEVIGKADGSPVTLADQEAERIITAALSALHPDIPVVGEEAASEGHVPDISGGMFWLVDPLDSTREFIGGGGEFTVNIGLMKDFKPVAGLIYVPAMDLLYYGAGDSAFRRKGSEDETRIHARRPPSEGLTIVASKRSDDPAEMQAFLQGRKVVDFISRSSALKFCSVAEGSADLYPRMGPTSEWDTAAGEAILRAAGGGMTMLDGSEFKYGKKEAKFLNPGFVAHGLAA